MPQPSPVGFAQGSDTRGLWREASLFIAGAAGTRGAIAGAICPFDMHRKAPGQVRKAGGGVCGWTSPSLKTGSFPGTSPALLALGRTEAPAPARGASRAPTQFYEDGAAQRGCSGRPRRQPRGTSRKARRPLGRPQAAVGAFPPAGPAGRREPLPASGPGAPAGCVRPPPPPL